MWAWAACDLRSSNWTENWPFSYDSHFATIEHRKVVIQPAYCRTIPCPKKHSLKKIGFIQLFSGKQNQSVLQRWVRQSVKTIVILTMCHVLEFKKILDSNYTRIGLSIYVTFSLGKWLGTRQNIIQIIHKKIEITPAVECVTKSITIVFVIKSLQFEISQECKHDLSINQHIYVYLSWVIMSWLSNNIPILPFQRCCIRFA